MNSLFANKYALMKAAGQHADVCLLNTQDGWITFGTDAQIVRWAIPLGLDAHGQTVISPRYVATAIRRLTDAGHSVALLDYWSPSLTVKPQPTLIVRLGGKVTEDWI